MLSFSFKFNNLPAVCFSRDSPAPLVHRQTAQSVGNLTQHKLHCEAEVSESVGCIYPDRGTMKNWKAFYFFTQAAARAINPSVVCWTLLCGLQLWQKKKIDSVSYFIHCLCENGLKRTVSRLSSGSESKV